MQTHFLGDQEVAAYAGDLLDRLSALEEHFPTTWFPIGKSGDKVVATLLDIIDDNLAQRLEIHRIGFDRDAGLVSSRDPDSSVDRVSSPALLIDGPIHSGSTMWHAARWLMGKGVTDLITYGLVVKSSSTFIPNFFSVMIGEHDRAYFQLNRIPNHRLRKKPPFGVLRAIAKEDVDAARQSVTTDVASIAKITLADLWYEKSTKAGHHVYLYEINQEVAGFVHFYEAAGSRVVVDVIAVDSDRQGMDIGGMLLRWVESWCRSHKIQAIELFAIEERRTFYERYGYEPSDPLAMDLGGGERYFRMRRPMLYNILPDLLRA